MADLDYNQLMLNHLSRVFGEHDSARRLAAIGEIYTEDATLYEPDAIATGHANAPTTATRTCRRRPDSNANLITLR